MFDALGHDGWIGFRLISPVRFSFALPLARELASISGYHV